MDTIRTAVAALLLVSMLASGCAWSRGRSRVYAPGTDGTKAQITQDLHCWAIVWGGGRLGADCQPVKLELATEDTGFSDNFDDAVEALGVAVGRGFAAAAGTGAAATVAEAIAKKASEDRPGEEIATEPGPGEGAPVGGDGE